MDTHDKKTVGWWEWVQLPQTGLKPFKAKVDSGASVSSMHASNIEEFEKDGETWVRFLAHGDDSETSSCEFKVIRMRPTRSSNGIEQIRYVVEADITIGSETYTTQFTLAERSKMQYRMLLGKHDLLDTYFLIDCASKSIQGKPNA